MDAPTIQVFQQFQISVRCGQYGRSWRGGGRQSVLISPGSRICHRDWREKLKNVGKNWVLLQVHSLREAIPSLVLTDKATKRQNGMIFTQ